MAEDIELDELLANLEEGADEDAADEEAADEETGDYPPFSQSMHRNRRAIGSRYYNETSCSHPSMTITQLWSNRKESHSSAETPQILSSSTVNFG